MTKTVQDSKPRTPEQQEPETAAFLEALKDQEKREQIIALLEAAGLLP